MRSAAGNSVAGAARKARAEQLRRKGAARLAAYLASQIDRECDVLVEEPGLGRTAHYAPVRFDGDALPGSLVRVRTTSATDDALRGVLVA